MESFQNEIGREHALYAAQQVMGNLLEKLSKPQLEALQQHPNLLLAYIYFVTTEERQEPRYLEVRDGEPGLREEFEGAVRQLLNTRNAFLDELKLFKSLFDDIQKLTIEERELIKSVRPLLEALRTETDADHTKEHLHGTVLFRESLRPAAKTPALEEVDEAENARRLKNLAVEAQDAGDLLTTSEMAKRLSVSVPTVHKRIKEGRLIAWPRAGKRGYVLPAEQLDTQGRPPEGLDQVLALFPNHRVAWEWLSDRVAAVGERRPIVLLQKGELEIVLNAARGQRWGDFG